MQKAWEFKARQEFTVDERIYDVHAAIRYSEELPTIDIPLDGLNIDYGAPCSNSVRSYAQHMKQVLDADLTQPIILNEHGIIIDGRHRVIKALVYEKPTILAKRFKEDPKDIYDIQENKK